MPAGAAKQSRILAEHQARLFEPHQAASSSLLPKSCGVRGVRRYAEPATAVAFLLPTFSFAETSFSLAKQRKVGGQRGHEAQSVMQQ